MTEHSIKELARQLDEARSKLANARLAVSEAQRRLHNAQVLDSGLVGKLAVHQDRKGETRILVDDVHFWGTDSKWFSVSGRMIKKDGTVGIAERTIYASRNPTFSEFQP